VRVAIVGSRAYPELEHVRQLVNTLSPWDVVVSGGARGVDITAQRAADERGLVVEVVAADWRLGPRAGPIRNTEIVRRADRVVAFWDGRSKGTSDTIRQAVAAGKSCEIRMPGPPPDHRGTPARAARAPSACARSAPPPSGRPRRSGGGPGRRAWLPSAHSHLPKAGRGGRRLKESLLVDPREGVPGAWQGLDHRPRT
jgi:hypothetical protein